MAKTRIEKGTRMHVIVPGQYQRALIAYARRTGVNVSEHVRRAIEAYLREVATQIKKS